MAVCVIDEFSITHPLQEIVDKACADLSSMASLPCPLHYTDSSSSLIYPERQKPFIFPKTSVEPNSHYLEVYLSFVTGTSTGVYQARARHQSRTSKVSTSILESRSAYIWPVEVVCLQSIGDSRFSSQFHKDINDIS